MLKKIMIILGILTLLVISIAGYGIYRFFNRFGPLVKEELSDSYFYNRNEDGVVYSPMGNWFSLGHTPMEIDMESFEVLSRRYAKDQNTVYYEGHKLAYDVDIPSFIVKWDDVPMDKNYVYRYSRYNGFNEETADAFKRVEGADPETYHLIAPDRYDFAKDKDHIFYNGLLLSAVHRDSFELLSDHFCKDQNAVFLYAHSQPFKKLPTIMPDQTIAVSYGYIRDNSQLYTAIYDDEEERYKTRAIPFQDSTTLHFYNARYMAIDGKVYFDSALMKGAEADSFELDDGVYTKDANHIFYLGTQMNADMGSFTVYEAMVRQYSSDANHVFYRGEVIPKADPKSFRLLEQGYSKDANHVFYWGERIEEADVTSFTLDKKTYQFKDKNHNYVEGKPQ